MAKKITNEEFQDRLVKLRNMGFDVFTDDVYVDYGTHLNFYCSKNHHWPATPSNIFQGTGCPHCGRKRAIVGKTDLWTTHPDVAILLANSEDGYRYSRGSDAKVDFICPCCGTIHNKRIANVCNRGFSCDVCSDGISYPNKFMRALLSQLPVENVVYEWNPDWLRPYQYDSYFQYNGYMYVLEMDGGVGHGCRKYKSTEIDTEGKERDGVKDNLARKHNISVIRINCDYGNNSQRYLFIKNNILNSDLPSVVDLSKVDWDKCNSFACTSMVFKTSLLYEDGKTTKEIMASLECSKSAVETWLKQGVELGLCKYTPVEMKKRGCVHRFKSVNQYTLDGIFIQSFISISDASQQINIGLTSIVRCCKKYQKSAGGFIWYYADDPTQPDPAKIIPNKMIKEE